VSRRARTWAAAAASLALIAGGALAYGQLSGTFAIFTAETENQNAVFKGSWIPAPSAATSSYNGSPFTTVHLAWTSGASTVMPSGSNPVTGQTVQYANGGTAAAASCPAIGSYTTFKTETAAATTDDVAGTDTNNWWCFAVYSTSAGAWTSGSVTFTARRIFIPTALSQNDGASTAGNVVGASDQIVLTFNQNATLSGTINVRICNTADTILISTAALGSCGVTPNIGTLSGQTQSSNQSCFSSSVTGSGTTTLTITIAGCGGTSNVGAGTETFTPANPNVITSASGASVCTATASPDCTPTTTTRY
jgi:hypothetical protein